MAKYCLKKPSKRAAVAKRHKIAKKVKEHNRKLTKETKKNKQWKSRGQKPLHIPNSCPFKGELLQQAEEERAKIKAAADARRAEAKQRKQDRKRKSGDGAAESKEGGGDALQRLVKKAQSDGERFDERQLLDVDVAAENKITDEKSVRTYAAEVRRTIESADVVIEVLDARDPLGSRSATAERAVLDAGKRLVLLLNKIDLVPRVNVQKWMTALRGELPTVAFKASTQEQQDRLGRFAASNTHSAAGTAKCVGADLLMSVLANYARNKDIRTSIRVGVIGFPNVGKSSVINSLKRRRACQTGAQPGITKQAQEVDLGGNIRLIDTPGVVLAAPGELDQVELALRNTVRLEAIAEPVQAVQAILRRCPKESLMLHYTLADFSDTDSFLALLARRLGRLGKGGRPNLVAAAKKVLQDWTSGAIKYYTEPPEQEDAAAGEAAGAERIDLEVNGADTENTKVVSAMDDELDIDALLGAKQDEMLMDALSDARDTGAFALKRSLAVEDSMEE